jgi:putative salt-induced outer membrane protein YdiY
LSAKKATKKPKAAWRFKLDMGVQTASGNSDALRANGSASASKETELNSYFLKSTGRYGESDDEQDAESATLEAKAQHRLSERMYAAVDGHVLHDRIADLSCRARTSVSLGRHFIWTGRTVLSVETGPGYVAERKGDDREGFLAGRVAQHLEFMVTDSLQVWQSLEYVSNLEDSRVYFVNAEVGLETVLVANLSLRFSIEDRYDSHPAEGKKNNDLLTATALGWSF